MLKTSKIEARGGYPIGLWDQKWTKFRSWVLLWLLGCLGGVLGVSWGAFWDRLERLLGPNLGPKMEPTWAKNRSQIRLIFGCLLESIFACGFWVPKWSQVGTKMGSNIVVYLEGRFFKIRALAAARAVPRGYPIGRSDGVPPLALTAKMESKLGCILISIFH